MAVNDQRQLCNDQGTADLDTIFAETKRLVELIHKAGLLQEFQSLRDQNIGATETFQILANRYPDLKTAFERKEKSNLKSRLITPAGHNDDPVMDAIDAVREERHL